jgi:hypothetical protein
MVYPTYWHSQTLPQGSFAVALLNYDPDPRLRDFGRETAVRTADAATVNQTNCRLSHLLTLKSNRMGGGKTDCRDNEKGYNALFVKN